MVDEPGAPQMEVMKRTVVDSGGLRFEATFRAPAGATLRVFGEVEGHQQELLRFDDFIEAPHYHAPSDGDQIPFDRAAKGEPLAWFVAQIRDHLAELLTQAGFSATLAGLDLDAVSASVDEIRHAMEACAPAGYVRVPGVGLRALPA
jgi:hypothetical protein